jgi:hypothetical protein
MLAERGAGHVDVLIVTVNAAEYEVLKGAEETLGRMSRHGRVFAKTDARTPAGGTILDDVTPFHFGRAFRVLRTRCSRAKADGFHEGDAFAHKS